MPLDYSQKYIEACFYAWYRAGAPSVADSNGQPSVGGAHIVKALPPDENGRKPGINTIRRWMDNYGWRQRADALDAQVSVKLDKEVINERVKTLRTLAQNGKALKEKGLKFIEDTQDPFAGNPSAAVRAIVSGAEMEFRYAGQAAILENIADMTNKQLENEILKLLGKEASEQQNEDETIDSTPEDIPGENEDSEDDDS